MAATESDLRRLLSEVSATKQRIPATFLDILCRARVLKFGVVGLDAILQRVVNPLREAPIGNRRQVANLPHQLR